MAAPNIRFLSRCVKDAKEAIANPGRPPRLAKRLRTRLSRLRKARPKLPVLYRSRVVTPLMRSLRRDKTLLDYWSASDYTQAVLQQANNYHPLATDAFQKVVSDTFDGFLTEAERAGASPVQHLVVAPLVKWSDDDEGPYAIAENEFLGIHVGYVALPSSHAARGLFGWTLLPHEAAGHDILGANAGLTEELERKVRRAVEPRLRDYWSTRIEETASDVIGALNLGPAAAIGLIGYFRGWNDADTDEGPVLLLEDDPADEHAAEVLRAYVLAEVVRLLSFDDAEKWARVLIREVNRDAERGPIKPAGVRIGRRAARKAAKAVARVIATSKLQALGGFSLRHIQDWRNEDEDAVADLSRYIRTRRKIPATFPERQYAAHALAAAVMAALAGTEVRKAFSRMKRVLKSMQTETDGTWGPV